MKTTIIKSFRIVTFTLLSGIIISCGSDSTEAPIDNDIDKDGIVNTIDTCPNTPTNDSPDQQGCGLSQLDSDNDGSSNAIDICPNTPNNDSPNNQGCGLSQLDSDNDGSSNAIDMCTDTPNNDSPNADGCGLSQLDTDNDGLNDKDDQCADTPAGTVVDSVGCKFIDTDQDTVSDALDLCQNTQDGKTVDSNGCASYQRDTDSDSVNDETDQCPATPITEMADATGCGPSQKDTDKDGVLDVVDLCLYTPVNDPVDFQGCGPFIESDGVVVVEMESFNLQNTQWQVIEDTSAMNNKAIEWLGEDSFTEANKGVIEVSVNITKTGTYYFDWANKIGTGTSATEHNDTWVKVESATFYNRVEHAEQGTLIACPHGLSSAENNCVVSPATVTETAKGVEHVDIVHKTHGGNNKQGYFKAYRRGTPLDTYKWDTRTYDFNPRAIYADFDAPGIYKIFVAGRSKHHVIDRLKLTHTDLAQSTAQQAPESERVGEQAP
ncbi:thrombospondin type 3 repeat-containing protein [Algibacillus agarilyticus]|uniref:thrombospondin type 3 repeat-containing protein n=1 Tax=Algibacillus agarilyticus TaxID=2234133 RepID=UPI000DD00AB3|nr:thrombospondin type 3 repeat-containing protein [Algibacillus agarilyticus]